MNDSMKKNAGNLSRWLIIGVLGLLLIVGQHIAKTILYTLFAVGLLLAGAAGAYGWWQHRSTERDDLVNLLGSIALAVVGIWIMRNTDGFDKIINVLNA